MEKFHTGGLNKADSHYRKSMDGVDWHGVQEWVERGKIRGCRGSGRGGGALSSLRTT